MLDVGHLGVDWLYSEIDNLTDHIEHIKPSDFNEQVRYLPDSVTTRPGYISYDVMPFLREIIDCCDPESPVKEVNIMKGVQIGYTTLLESALLYYIAHIRTKPTMLISADKELVRIRIENYIIPMLKHSELSHLIQSADEGNGRKTGKTKDYIQWVGGGFMIPAGANNADKLRSFSIQLMLKDEIDAWQDTVGKDGNPDDLTDARCSSFWGTRKIFRGSTPLIKGKSKIYYQYKRGDQRKFMVFCNKCNFQQPMRWNTVNEKNGIVGGFTWDIEDNVLISDSVRWCCAECGHPHQEHDKIKLFAEGEWVPTAKPKEKDIRSYHLPGYYSPAGFKPWSACVSDYIKGWDVKENKVKDVGKYQVFYNNVLGEPFEIRGSKILFRQVSCHRRRCYRLGEIPNHYAKKFSGSDILFLTCTVDVHKRNLAVAIIGWCKHARPYLIDYKRLESNDCTDIRSSCWVELRKIIEETTYTSDNDKKYQIMMTLIDAGYANDTVVTFCSDYSSNVYPILGRDRPSKNQSIKEFAPFETASGTRGYRIIVDHYKDRISPVLRRDWSEDNGPQDVYHFNAPVDLSDAALRELTVEVRREKKDSRGIVSYEWYRPGNARNELWDLLIYGYASVEIIAWNLCIESFKLNTVDWEEFWGYYEDSQ